MGRREVFVTNTRRRAGKPLVVTAAMTTHPTVGAVTPTPGFRPDIEGLRAVAVLSVLIYHAGLVWVPGGFVGVDIFFVISGFLITSLMVREIDRKGRLGLADFWARRARRLLPASAVVLVFSAVVSLLWLPVTSRREFGGDIVSAACYLVNWRLGYREVDYLAENVGVSPVQHYWSLAVEEQFYVLWPLLIVALVTVFRARWRLALLVGIGVVTAASFVFTLSYAVAQPGLAFFVSTTRLWELGVGALLAIALPTLAQLPAALRGALGWIGIAMVGYGVLAIDSAAVWPGTATLLPVMGTAAAILAGAGSSVPWGVGRLLALRPAVWIGGLSYSLYLWHWPFLVAAEGIWGELRVREAVLVLLASAVPAWLSYRYLENPLRRSPRFARPRPALIGGAIAMTVSAVAGLALVASFSFVKTVDVASATEAPGAMALQQARFADVDWASLDEVDAMRPTPLNAYGDTPAFGGCVGQKGKGGVQTCEFGRSDSDRTMVLVGDSKAVQWFSPIKSIAEQEGWRLVVIAKNACQFADVVRLLNDHRNPSCDAWAPQALDSILRMRPDVVLTSTRWDAGLPPDSADGATPDDYSHQAMVDGLVSYWRQIVAAGAEVVPLLDNPSPPGGDVPGCVQENLAKLSACGFPKATGVASSGAPTQVEAAAEVPGTKVIDMSDVLCPDATTCPAVIGNVLAYRSGSHVSDTYARTSTQALSAALAKATAGLLGRP